MARHLPTEDPICKQPESPAGFWPNPEEELFYKRQTPLWKVPRKRKSRGGAQEFYFDLEKNDIIWKKCGEITTHNKFDLIDPDMTRFETNDHEDFYISSKKNSDIPYFDLNIYDDFFTEGDVINESFKDFMRTKGKNSNSKNHFMYDNKNNFCSGYFPDFITLNDDFGYNISEGNNYSHYYLYVKNKKYLKPLSDSKSKYNNSYFDSMSFAYKVSKKHKWESNFNTNSNLQNTNLFKNSYICKNSKKTSRDTGRGIPEVMNKNFTSKDSRRGIQRGYKGDEELESNGCILRESGRGFPLDTGVRNISHSRSKYSKPKLCLNPIQYNNNHSYNPQGHYLNKYHDSIYDYGGKNNQNYLGQNHYSQKIEYKRNHDISNNYSNSNYIHDPQINHLYNYFNSNYEYRYKSNQNYVEQNQYSQNREYNRNKVPKYKYLNQNHDDNLNYKQGGKFGHWSQHLGESEHYDQNPGKNKPKQRSKSDQYVQNLDKGKPNHYNHTFRNVYKHKEQKIPMQYSKPQINLQNNNKQQNKKKNKKENNTPAREKIPRPRKKLFHNPEEDKTDMEVIPVDTDLEILLVNSWKVDAPKIQDART